MKNRIVCVDYSRRKIVYKDEDGELVSDPEMSKLAPKLFRAIEERNTHLIEEYIKELRKQLFQSDGNDEMTKEETFKLNTQTTMIINHMSEMVTYMREVKEVAEGLKPDMYPPFLKDMCSNSTT